MNALVAMENGISLRKASEMYRIPKSTLHDHFTGKVSFGARPGPDPYLTDAEEEEFVNFLVQIAGVGYPRTRKQVLALVQRIIESKGITSRTVSNGWWERFIQRNPRLTLRSPVPLSMARAAATDPEILSRYFDTLEVTLKTNEILDDPRCIYNCDETGLPLNPSALRVVQEVGTKNPNVVTGGDKSQVTVLACTNAAGQYIPPYIIFDRVTWNAKLAEGEIPGSLYGLSRSGWMNSELFYSWFSSHFLKYIPSTRPILLLVDGHSSHYCPEFIKTAAKEGVVVFVLPPNTTHLAQPLDKGCFSPLKVGWRQACHEFRTRYPGRVVTRYDFTRVFAEAWYMAMTPGNIIASYRTTGVCPFNRYAIPGMEKCTSGPASKTETALVEGSKLKFIPLLSPCRGKSVTSSIVSPHTAVMTPCTPVPTSSYPKPLARLYSAEPETPLSISERFTRAASVSHPTSTTISNFLNPLIPQPADKNHPKQSHGCCLTSKEGLQRIEEKEKEKEEKLKIKLERQRKKELKAAAKGVLHCSLVKVVVILSFFLSFEETRS